MSLKEKLQEDLKSSMKNKDTIRKSVITLVRAAIKQIEVDQRVELDDVADMGKIMAIIKPKTAGRADGRKINELVKKNL